VVAWPPVIVPPPDTTAKVTTYPGTGIPTASVILTEGSVVTARPGRAVWLLPAKPVRVAGTGAVAVAAKLIGLPFNPADVATRLWGPGVEPSLQLPTVASPKLFDVAVPPVTLPLPLAGVNVTVTFATGLLLASVTFTDGAVATTAPAVAV